MKKDTYNPVFYVVGDRQQLLYLLRVQQARWKCSKECLARMWKEYWVNRITDVLMATYRRMGVPSGLFSTYGNSIKIIVYFADGRVTSMDTFNGDEILLPPPVMMPPSVVLTNTPPVCPPQYEETSRRRTLMMHDEFDRFLRDFRMVIMPTEQIKYIDDVLLECNFTSAQCGKDYRSD